MVLDLPGGISMQPVYRLPGHVCERRGAQLREKNCQALLVQEAWVPVQLFFVFIMGLCPFPCTTSPVPREHAAMSEPPACGPCRGLGLCPGLRCAEGSGAGRARGGGELHRVLHMYCVSALVQSLQSNVKAILKCTSVVFRFLFFHV